MLNFFTTAGVCSSLAPDRSIVSVASWHSTRSRMNALGEEVGCPALPMPDNDVVNLGEHESCQSRAGPSGPLKECRGQRAERPHSPSTLPQCSSSQGAIAVLN